MRLVRDSETTTLESIEITTPATKLSYFVGEELDITGLVVTGTYSDGSKKTLTITEENVTGFDSSVAIDDKQTLTITVNGKATTYEVEIKADPSKVATEEDLINALNDTNLGTLTLTNDITLIKDLVINREVVIDGNDKKINLNGVFTGGGIVVSGDNVQLKDINIIGSETANVFNVQFYNVKGGKLNNVILSNSKKGGLLVNGSEVTVTGIKTENNTWGGIEVSQGSGVTEEPKLTVTDAGEHIEGNNPAIWIDGKTTNDGWVVADEYKTIELPEGKDNQLWFVLKQ